eukprot:jgi/Undpi1/11356/HiC_scaffold_30.g13653.m1
MAFIRDGGRQVGKRFADVLKLFWEGLLFEYLRSEGCPLRHGEHDPRHFIMRYWRRSLLDPSIRTGFVPFYLKREAKKRNSIIQEDKDIRDIRAGLIVLEERVKDAETGVRGQHDYRFVLQYFSASRDLHRTLVGNVTSLANEVEQLRANVDHNSESISIMEQQFVELETKYDRVVGGLVHRGAFQLTVERALYGIINEGHACIKAAERMVTELLADMDVGLPAPDSAEPYLQVANGNTSNVPGIDVALAAAASVTQESTKGSTEMQNVDQKTWAAPRSKSWDTCGDGIQDSSGERTAAAVAAAAKMAPYVSEGWKPGDSCLGSCLRRVWETHRKSCKSYANRVAKLEGQNVALVARASEACRLQQEAEAQARAWEEKHRLLEQRIADVESRSRAELSLAQQANSEASSRVREAHSLFQGALERATPTLLDMVAAFAPRDTEKLALDLFLKLGVERDLYVHHLEAKRMFETDLESRVFEILEEEQTNAAVGAGSLEHEETAGSRKKERGRPKSKGKGKGVGAADKSKNSKSRSKTPSGKASKTAEKSDKGEDKGGKRKAAGKGKGKQKPPQAEKGPSSPPGDNSGASNVNRGSDRQGSAKAQRSSSPAKKGAAKGNRQRKN